MFEHTKDGDDATIPQRSGASRLIEYHLSLFLVSGVGGQDLECDWPVQHQVPCTIDDTQTTSTQLTLDDVSGKLGRCLSLSADRRAPWALLLNEIYRVIIVGFAQNNS
jgi:hypothetical protein